MPIIAKKIKISQAARTLKVTPRTIQSWIKNGKIPDVDTVTVEVLRHHFKPRQCPHCGQDYEHRKPTQPRKCPKCRRQLS